MSRPAPRWIVCLALAVFLVTALFAPAAAQVGAEPTASSVSSNISPETAGDDGDNQSQIADLLHNDAASDGGSLGIDTLTDVLASAYSSVGDTATLAGYSSLFPWSAALRLNVTQNLLGFPQTPDEANESDLASTLLLLAIVAHSAE